MHYEHNRIFVYVVQYFNVISSYQYTIKKLSTKVSSYYSYIVCTLE